MMLDLDEAIDELGGNSGIAEALGIDDSTVSTWRRRGIPADRWPALVRLAAELGKSGSITFEFLAALPKPAREAAA